MQVQAMMEQRSASHCLLSAVARQRDQILPGPQPVEVDYLLSCSVGAEVEGAEAVLARYSSDWTACRRQLLEAAVVAAAARSSRPLQGAV